MAIENSGGYKIYGEGGYVSDTTFVEEQIIEQTREAIGELGEDIQVNTLQDVANFNNGFEETGTINFVSLELGDED